MTNPAIRRLLPAVAALSVALLTGACTGTVPPPAPAETIVEEEWKEVELTLPAYPRDADLLPMLLSRNVPVRILIDSRSVSVGRDDVVRYTVVMQGAGGARSTFHEGIRCDTREFKVYAYGTHDGQWAPMATSVWEKIYNRGMGAFRYEAYRNYLCAVGGRILKPADIVHAIRNPQPVFEDN